MTDRVESVSRCPGWTVSPEELAAWFHSEYERLAPEFGYSTRKASAVSWEDVPEANKTLMVAVSISVIRKWFPHHDVRRDLVAGLSDIQSVCGNCGKPTNTLPCPYCGGA